MKIHCTLLILVLLGFSGLAQAQWQWLDKEGHKVFSDRAPPPDVPEKNILKRPMSAAKTAAAAPVAADEASGSATAAMPAPVASHPAGAGLDKELEAKKKQAVEAEAAKRRAEEEKITKARIESCARAKQAKADLDSGIRMARTNAAGEREILDDAARAAESRRIQGVIATDCR